MPAQTIAEIVQLLSSYRLASRDEKEVQSRIEQVLVEHRVAYIREYRLKRGPIDFYLSVERVGIEVKVKGGPSDVLSQLLDYADDERLAGIVLVTTKPSHQGIVPPTLRGKPAGIVAAWKGF